MPTISPLSMSGFDATEFMEAIYKPNISTPDSLEVINGWLDSNNLSGSLTQEDVQSDAFVVGGQVSGNGPIDYFDDLFEDVVASPSDGLLGEDQPDLKDRNFLAIPGANATYFLPWRPKFVLFSWHITWLVDSTYASNDAGVIRFGLRKANETGRVVTFYDSQRRVCPYSSKVNKSNDLIFVEGMQNHWNGHKLLQWPDTGTEEREWWTAGLYIKSAAPHARVFNRSFRWIALRGQ